MGYTLSFDASQKCNLGSVKLLLRHIARNVDRDNGIEINHKNKDIDSSRTDGNATLVRDDSGKFVHCKNTQEIMDALNSRLKHVKKPLRKDAVVLRPLIVQLDPEWYKGKTNDEIYKSMGDMFSWCVETFGADNIIYGSSHMDETNPHLHIGFCPVTEDGRLSQKEWFSGPGSLRKMHDSFRKHMKGRGYDIATERKKPGKYAKRMSEEEYKDYMELQKALRAVEASKAQIEAEKAKVGEMYLNLSNRLNEVNNTQRECESLRDSLYKTPPLFEEWLDIPRQKSLGGAKYRHRDSYDSWLRRRDKTHDEKLDEKLKKQRESIQKQQKATWDARSNSEYARLAEKWAREQQEENQKE